MTPSTLSSFGVRTGAALAYLLDVDRNIIVAEGTPRAVEAKVKTWEEVAPGRYRAVAGGDADPGTLYEWKQFKVRSADHWVIR